MNNRNGQNDGRCIRFRKNHKSEKKAYKKVNAHKVSRAGGFIFAVCVAATVCLIVSAAAICQRNGSVIKFDIEPDGFLKDGKINSEVYEAYMITMKLDRETRAKENKATEYGDVTGDVNNADSDISLKAEDEDLPSVYEAEEVQAENNNESDRNYYVTLDFYGRDNISCATGETTVGALLDKLGVSLDQSQLRYVNTDYLIKEDTTIYVDTVEYKTEAVTESIPYDTVYHDLQTIPRGSENISVAGQNGVRTAEYNVMYVNGAEVSRNMISEYVSVSPTSAEVYRGVGGTVTGKDGIARSYSYYIDCEATFYYSGGGSYSGLPATEDVIAVDPSVISLLSKVYVSGDIGDFGVRIAADIGSAIKGNKIDVCLDASNPITNYFGRENLRVYILD